jgi:hypothetical protein
MIFNIEPLGGPAKSADSLPLVSDDFKLWSFNALLAEVKRRELKCDFNGADELREALFKVTVGTQ